ncbi:MAG: DUF3472 domain-containing protein [Clostridia bacterium]|nr:DUF3472 domain-containing protein [Clostridia bacterium]
MKKIFIRVVAAVITIVMLLCGSTLTSSAAGEMAYNLYTHPDMSKTGDVHTTYMIDFRAPKSTYGTYWALANFGMEINRDTLKKYRGLTLGGGYAGMQYYSARNCKTDRVGILSFWHWEYRDTKSGQMVELEAERLYPYGPQVHFGGEGTGTQSIQDYAWVDNQWYTMVLHTWEDVENQSTFAGEWILDQKTGIWTLVTYYDTKMINSGWTGDMGLFMENFMSSRREGVREFNVKGMYVLDRDTKEWDSINKVGISWGNGGTANKVGTHEYGVNTEEGYFWGRSDGTMREDQAAHDAAWPEKKTFTITQPDKPTFGTLSAPEITLNKTDRTGVEVSWTAAETSTPHVGFKVEILDEQGKVVTSKELTRPELKALTFQENLPAEYNCRVTVTDIFGQTVTAEKATAGYTGKGEEPSEVPSEEPSVSPSAPAESSPAESKPAEGGDESSFDPTPVIITVVVAVAVAVVAVGVVVIVKKKKKN